MGPRGLASPSLGGPLAGPSDPSLLLLGARVAVVWRLGCSPYRGLFRINTYMLGPICRLAQSADWASQSADWDPICRLGPSLQTVQEERPSLQIGSPSADSVRRWGFLPFSHFLIFSLQMGTFCRICIFSGFLKTGFSLLPSLVRYCRALWDSQKSHSAEWRTPGGNPGDPWGTPGDPWGAPGNP